MDGSTLTPGRHSRCTTGRGPSLFCPVGRGQSGPMLKGALAVPLVVVALATSVYPFPSWSMLRSAKVATPFTTVTVFVPERVPGASMPPLSPMATVTWPLKLVAGLPRASSTVTCTAGRMVSNGIVVLGWTVNARCNGGLSTSAVASQVLGELKYQVHCGSSEPVLAGTV